MSSSSLDYKGAGSMGALSVPIHQAVTVCRQIVVESLLAVTIYLGGLKVIVVPCCMEGRRFETNKGHASSMVSSSLAIIIVSIFLLCHFQCVQVTGSKTLMCFLIKL